MREKFEKLVLLMNNCQINEYNIAKPSPTTVNDHEKKIGNANEPINAYENDDDQEKNIWNAEQLTRAYENDDDHNTKICNIEQPTNNGYENDDYEKKNCNLEPQPIEDETYLTDLEQKMLNDMDFRTCDKEGTMASLTNNMLEKVFTRVELGTSNLTGQSAPSMKNMPENLRKVKKKLHPGKLKFIKDYVCRKYKMDNKLFEKIVRNKCNNRAKTMPQNTV